MSTQYDAIATDYQRTKESPLRRYVEAYSFLRLAGNVQNKSVLDLACGEGFYTRLFRQAGAREVTGVDISAGMIELARQAEAQQPLGIRYQCADVSSLSMQGPFDLISAAYLLHYASSVAELTTMCQRIAGLLAPGGRFVAINENPMQTAEDCAGYAQYGFNKSVQLPRVDGSPIEYAMVSGRSMIRFNAYYYGRETYATVLKAAGFSQVHWHELELDPAGIAECGADYFREYLDNPPVVSLECIR